MQKLNDQNIFGTCKVLRLHKVQQPISSEGVKSISEWKNATEQCHASINMLSTVLSSYVHLG